MWLLELMIKINIKPCLFLHLKLSNTDTSLFRKSARIEYPQALLVFSVSLTKNIGVCLFVLVLPTKVIV